MPLSINVDTVYRECICMVWLSFVSEDKNFMTIKSVGFILLVLNNKENNLKIFHFTKSYFCLLLKICYVKYL